jgi:hypothetical protein
MTTRLDHTIVPAKDKIASAEFFSEIFGVTVEHGYFAQVQVNDSLTLDLRRRTRTMGWARVWALVVALLVLELSFDRRERKVQSPNELRVRTIGRGDIDSRFSSGDTRDLIAACIGAMVLIALRGRHLEGTSPSSKPAQDPRFSIRNGRGLSVALSLAPSPSIARIPASGAPTGTVPSCYRV